MNAISAATQPYASIGEVLSQLRPDFPDTTISKLRFLESEGLVDPERTPAGYRKYSDTDIARLRYVLTAQRDHYLPLKVIREQLSDMDRGIEAMPQIPGLTPGSAPQGSARPGDVPQQRTALRAVRADDQAPSHTSAPSDVAVDSPASDSALRLTRVEFRERANINEGFLSQLEQFGLVASDPGGMFAEPELAIAQAAAGLSGYGIEPRHIRTFRGAVDREIGLYTQVVKPLTHRRSRDSSDDAVDPAQQAAAELCALSSRLHTAMVQSALRRTLPGLQ